MTNQYQKRQWAMERLLRRLWLAQCQSCRLGLDHIHGSNEKEIQEHADWTLEAVLKEEMKQHDR